MKELIELAKEKGFKSVNAYHLNPECDISIVYSELDIYLWLCELQKWLRDEHDLYVNADISPLSGYFEWFVHSTKIDLENIESGFAIPKEESKNFEFHLYESALLEGLKKALKYI